jgi:hypothetical protein
MARRLKCFSLVLGARNTRARGKRFTRGDNDAIHAITFRHFPDGFTILNADGGWFDPAAKRFIEEESRQILVCATSAAALRPWCTELAEALDQQELLVVELGPALTFRRRGRRLRVKKA